MAKLKLMPRISIIIPVGIPDDNFYECIEHCRNLDYTNYEIIVLPDEALKLDVPGIRTIPTGHTDPSTKRNIGIDSAEGEICAFIDSDAFPIRNWLSIAAASFWSKEIAAVGGPNLTPDDDSPMQQANGIIFSSLLGGRRYKVRYNRVTELDGWELQTVNMLARKSVLKKLNGFQVGLWPGEDAKLSFQISDILKMKQLYIPKLIVYHHRRKLFRPYLSQVWRSGITKGTLIKDFFSLRRLEYFIPSLFVVGLFLGPVLLPFSVIIRVSYLLILGVYILGALFTGMRTGNLKIGASVFIGIILTHLTYGVAFLSGLLRRGSV